MIVYVVTTCDLGGNSGTVICGAFTSEELAHAWIDNAWDAIKTEPWAQSAWWGKRTKENTYEIEEVDLDSTPKQHTYWHRGAHVLPDGTVQDWCIEHRGEGDPMEPADDHLEPWDGHTQGHCGWHISLFGSDRDAVEAAYQRQVASVLPKCDGTCQFCGRSSDYKLDFWDGKNRLTT